MKIKLFCKTFYYLVFNFNTVSGILLVQPGVPPKDRIRPAYLCKCRKKLCLIKFWGTGQCLLYNNAILLLSYFRMIYERRRTAKMRVKRGNKKECRSFM